jgi:putative proteasome-type protease
MTYCCGLLVREGLVMIADTRTNAGVDNISTFRKLHIFEKPNDRVVMIATAGNLSVSQNVLSHVTAGLDNPDTGERETIATVSSMFAAAQLVGRAVRKVRETLGASTDQVNYDVTMLLGGQLAGRNMRLFMVYSAGNFIEATEDTPYLQIGEHKYGKPVLDRAVNFESEIYDSLKLGLVSMDSTMRSNLGVGLPIDIALLRRDAPDLEINHRIDHIDPYFHDLRDRWSVALRQAHLNIPRPPYGKRRA